MKGTREINDSEGKLLKGEEVSAAYLYDVNGTINAKINAEDERYYSDPPPFVYFDSTYDGSIYSKNILHQGQQKMVSPTKSYQFVHNTDGKLLGGYSITGVSTFDQAMHMGYHKGRGNTDFKPAISPYITFNPNIAVAKFKPTDHDEDKRNEPLNDYYNQDVLSFIPETIIVQPGDTLESLSIKLFGDTHYAKDIAKINGLVSLHHALEPELILKVPKIITAHNKYSNARPYQQFVSIISGSLFPHLKTPVPEEDENNILGFLVKMIALGILTFSAAPWLAGLLFPSGILGGGLLSASTIHGLATAVIAGIGDAAIQGVAIEVGIQKHFSGAEVLETAVSAGVGTQLPNADSWKEVAENAYKIAAASVGTQLLEMKTGMRDKFDAKAIALQVSSCIVNYEISNQVKNIQGLLPKDVTPNLTSAVSATANTVLGSYVTGTPINIQNVAANAVGTVVTNTVNEGLSSNLASERFDDISFDAEDIANMDIQYPNLDTTQITSENIRSREIQNGEDNNFSGAIRYGLTERNRERMALNGSGYDRAQRWNTTNGSTKDWASVSSMAVPSEYFAAGKLAGIKGLSMNNSNHMTSEEQFSYAEGYQAGKAERFTSQAVDVALTATGIYDLARGAVYLGKKLTPYLAEKTFPLFSRNNFFRVVKGYTPPELKTIENIAARNIQLQAAHAESAYSVLENKIQALMWKLNLRKLVLMAIKQEIGITTSKKLCLY